MKIIHTGDWHIGKLVHQIHMTNDQKYVLKQFIDLVKEEKPDVILIAGDLYDRSVPPVEAVELLDNVLSKLLIDVGIPVLIIAGNHDSADRLSFGSEILKNKGLYIEGRLKKDIEPIVLHDEYGPVNFYLVPYTDPAICREIYEDNDIHNHDDAMKAVLDRIKAKLNKLERNILVTHAFVTGGESLETSDSERPLSIGGSEYVDVNYFTDFNYVALGHLHRPQKVGYEKIRYAGSLLKYSFSEARQKKSITILDMDEAGDIKLEQKSLKPLRDMRKIKGKLEKLLDPLVYKDTNLDDYLLVTIEDEGEILDIIGKLRSVYPNVLRIERETFSKSKDNMKASGQDYLKKSKLDLFSDFYTDMTGKEFNPEKRDIVLDVLKDVVKFEEVE